MSYFTPSSKVNHYYFAIEVLLSCFNRLFYVKLHSYLHVLIYVHRNILSFIISFPVTQPLEKTTIQDIMYLSIRDTLASVMIVYTILL